MAVCKKCGAELDPGAMECTRCGEPTTTGKLMRAGESMQKAGGGISSAGCSLTIVVLLLIIVVPLLILLFGGC